MSAGVRLQRVPGRYGVSRLASDAPMPDWLSGAGFTALIRADDEMTVVCQMDRIPEGTETDAPWACLRSMGPFDFHTAGIVQSLVTPLSDKGIGVFVLCTFDGEHILVADRDLNAAVAALTEAGHEFEVDIP
ncbi:ACT domain-containing protein [Hoeflea sp. CAU 1731]